MHFFNSYGGKSPVAGCVDFVGNVTIKWRDDIFVHPVDQRPGGHENLCENDSGIAEKILFLAGLLLSQGGRQTGSNMRKCRL